MTDVFDQECYPAKLEVDVQHFVAEIQHDLSKLTGKQFIGEVKVKKDLLEDNESGCTYGAVGDEDAPPCSVCNVDCNKIFLSESLTNLRYLSSFFRHSLEKVEHDREDASKMGSSIVLKSLMDLFSNSLATDKSFAIEVGGGGGAGFHVYCDDQKVLSAGGGGGGGLYYNYTASSTSDYAAYSNLNVDLGGGGGAGIQLFNKDDNTWHDVGGGGGCAGKSVDSQGFPVAVTCGYEKDKHSLNSAEMKQLMDAQFGLDTWGKCGSVRVEGGGGGGGGTGQCCAPFSLGFGFSFSMYSIDDFGGINSGRKLRNVAAAASVEPVSTDPDSSISTRIFSQSAVECKSSRDNWCCICTQSKDYVNHCLQPRYQPWQTFTNVTVSCDDVVDHQYSLEWMAQMDCCRYHNHSVYDDHRDHHDHSDGNNNRGNPAFSAYSLPIELAFGQSDSSVTRQLASSTSAVSDTTATSPATQGEAWSLYSYSPLSVVTTQFISDTIYDVTLYSSEKQQLLLQSSDETGSVLTKSDTFMQCFDASNTACMSTFNDTKFSLFMKLQSSGPLTTEGGRSVLLGPLLMVSLVLGGLWLMLKTIQKSNANKEKVTSEISYRGEYETIVFTREEDDSTL